MTNAQAVAQNLRADIAECADEIEAGRQLPAALVDKLKAAGTLRFLIPESVGGGGVELPDFIRALQILAEVDASTAWCVSQGAVIATTSLWLEKPTLTTLWSDPQMAMANGPPRGSTAVRESDGYRVTGNWGFSSGCQHATWMHGAVRRTHDNAWLGVFFPQSFAQFHDNWQTGGLAGTGSFEFSVDDLLVPMDYVVDFREPATIADPITRLPVGLVFAVSFAAVALGVARGGVDAAIAIAQGKVPAYSSATVRDDPDMQKLLGEAESEWRAVRAYLYDTVNAVWEALADQSRASDQQRIDLRMAGTYTMRSAAQVLDKAYAIAGSSAIYNDNPLQRRFQDMHTMTQHVQARLAHYGYVGRYLFGHPFKPDALN